MKWNENLRTETSWWSIPKFSSSFKLGISNSGGWNDEYQINKRIIIIKSERKKRKERLLWTFLTAIESAQKKYLALNSTFNKTPK